MGLVETIIKRLRPARRADRGPVMVVGMHRSGTSFLTGSLQLAGLELGKHSAWNPYNLKGNRENEDFVNFHEAVLTARGAAWNAPPVQVVAWSADERRQARKLADGYSGVSRWGFKDPRALLMVEEWQKLLPELGFVGIFRHPVAVARSLAGRGDMPQEQAFALWADYNRRLLALHRRGAFPLLCFDEEEALLHGKLNGVLRELGLQALDGERFFSAELKHHHDVPPGLPAELDELYRTLRALAR